MKLMVSILAAVLIFMCPPKIYAEVTVSKVWETPADFHQPESVAYDAEKKILYVSNLDGEATAKDGNGFISKLALDGTITSLHWVGGLNAPKGLGILGKKLYTADIDALVEIDTKKGEISKRYPAKDAKFLNDVTIDQKGRVYVSDMVTSQIYRLAGKKFSLWLDDKGLECPNGLFAEENRLVVGAWGEITQGFNTKTPGRLKYVLYDTKEIKVIGKDEPLGHLDGVESDGASGYYVSDWMLGKIFHVDGEGTPHIILELGQGTADLKFIPEQKLLIIPQMNQNKIIAFKIENTAAGGSGKLKERAGA